MGIRYYAYAFDADVTDQALAAPRVFISRDPLADAWGLPHGFRVGGPIGEQGVSRRDMLYLDKAWSYLQRVAGPTPGRPARAAYRMFEGHVLYLPEGCWEPWIRALAPHEVADIAHDVGQLSEDDVATGLTGRDGERHFSENDVAYVAEYLRDAQEFVTQLAEDNRGFVYTIC